MSSLSLVLQTLVLLKILAHHVASGDCLCRGDSAVLQSDYVWKASAAYGFEPNITCGRLEELFATEYGCPDPKALREICCIDYERPRYVCAKTVRDSILTNEYDKLTVPAISSSFDPINVTMLLEYQAVTDIDIAAGTVELYVWVTLVWKDERLAWTYDANTTCTTYPVTARASMGGSSEIWVPELELYNRVSGLKSMGDSLASISEDGTVVWPREGKLKAICAFVNLGQIPFDRLGCQFMFGSVGAKAQFGVSYVLDPAGSLRIGDFSSPYSEYILDYATPGINVSETYGSEFIFFDFYFVRGTQFYMLNVVLPVTIFSVLSIMTMVLGLNSFQRIALNLTLLLVAVAQKISISRLLPVTDNSLWIVDYVAFSFVWIAVTLFETVLVAFFATVRENRTKEKEGSSESSEGATGIHDEEDNNNGDGVMEEKEEHWIYTFSLRTLDLICCFVSLLTYFIFLIIMFASRDTWGNNQVANSFLWSNTTTSTT